jgi:hypothetical protein
MLEKAPLDRRALKILLDTFWDRNKWRSKPHTEPDDLQYAIEQGVMFAPRSLDHDERVAWLLEAVSRIDASFVGRQFLASLSTRRLDRRSALGSFAYARYFPKHPHEPPARYSNAHMCMVCGDGELMLETNLNLENFYRHKWGGFMHTKPLYAAFDLEQSRWLDDCEPTSEDVAIMRALLDTIAALPPEATASDIVRKTAKLLPSNAGERRILINILGYCGVLESRNHPGWGEHFIPFRQTLAFPGTPRNDWPYPVVWWRRHEGINARALRNAFPGYDF